MIWKPSVTVAAIAERDGRFLLVEEHTDRGQRFNQPAGHLDPGESLIHAVARERARHRSPLVMRCIDDYLAGRRFALDVLHHHSS